MFRNVVELVILGIGAPEIEVVRAAANEESPDGTYATVRQMMADNRGMDWTATANIEQGTGVTVHAITPVQSVWEVNFYRKTADRIPFELARQFRAWLYGSIGLLEVRRRGFALQRTSGVRQLDSLAGQQWEERAQVDVYLGYYQKVMEDWESIDTVPLDISTSGDIIIRS